MSSNSDIESILSNEGFFLFTGSGTSMLPFVREGVDCVEVRPCLKPLKAGEVILYRVDDDYVLHRVIEVCQGYCLTRGDNCIQIESVGNEQIVAVMTACWRGEKEIDMSSMSYRIYVFMILRCPDLIRKGRMFARLFR